MIDFIGYSGTILSTMIYIPQIMKAYRKGNVKGISYGLLIIELITDVLWFIYAYVKDLHPLMYSNCFLFISCVILLGMKIRGRILEKRRRKEEARLADIELVVG